MAGVAPLTDGWPTLSELTSTSFDHLGQAADWFDRVADKAESAFAEIAREVRRPGGVEWEGAAGDAAVNRADMDLFKVRGRCWAWRDATAIARRGQDTLKAGQQLALDAVDDAERDGFEVGEDYRVTDTREVSTREQLVQRQAEAEAHSNFIRHRVAALVSHDRTLTDQLKQATSDFGNLTFQESPVTAAPSDPRDGRVQMVDNHTFKDAPNPAPDPPPGGWSSDPLMRAAQKIAYGHALDPSKHLKDFPGMTCDQLADLVYKMMQDSIDNPKDLVLGNSRSDGAPVIYDPKTNIVVIRDPTGAARKSDGGTVFKSPNGIDYILGHPDKEIQPKIKERVDSFSPGRLEDIPRPAGPPAAEPGPPKPAVRAPVEGAPRAGPPPGSAEGGGPMPRLPFGIGTPGDSPATGPHFVHPPHSHHRPPVLGELPDEMEDP